MQRKEDMYKISQPKPEGGAKLYKKLASTTVSTLLCFAILFLGTPITTWADITAVTGTINGSPVTSSDGLILKEDDTLVLTAVGASEAVSWSADVDFEDDTNKHIANASDATSSGCFSTWTLGNTSGAYNDKLTLKRSNNVLHTPATVTVTATQGSTSRTFKFSLAGKGYIWVSNDKFSETTTTNLADEEQVVVLPSDGSGTFYVAISPSKDSFDSGASDNAPLSAQVVEATNDTPIEGATATVDDSVNSIKITGATNGSCLKITSANSGKWLCEPAYVKLSFGNTDPDTNPTPESDNKNVKTGDRETQFTVAGIGSVLVLALGIMISLIKNKKSITD